MQLKNIIFIVTSLIFLNCKNQREVQQSFDLKVIGLIVDEIAIPVPPPPPPSPEEVDATLGKRTIDSIKSIKLNVGFNPVLVQFDNLLRNEAKYPSSFSNLIKSLPLKKPKDISNISLKNISRHNIQFTKEEDKNVMEQFDVLITLSDIVWSKDKERAAAIATRKLGKFNGNAYLFLFKRNKNTKEIKIYKKYLLQKS